ncbi:O-methyltransferase-domain-containing protein [Macrophomina phaseolina]|uniref:O-methyltransferase-domain-containing protein n=1 Tax=Macrophomina phaseolina TaxID=35725 RepID=A0ABQ8GHG0_9PEZI|nr:O-methyltransferase-domain-containing protein [Macrophomina phaseolina]
MSLSILAERILESAQQLDKRGVVDTDSKLGFRNMTPTDFRSRASLITALQELERLARGPMESVWALGFAGSVQVMSLHAIARHEVPLHVPDEGISFAALAAKAKMDEQALTRLVRHAVAYGVFRETEQGFITHTPMSKLMRDDEDWLDAAKWATEDNWSIAVRAVDALERWPGSHKPTETAFNLSRDTSDTFFEHLAKFPQKLKTLSGHFRAVSALPSHRPDDLSRSRLWREIDMPRATLVDVGGNYGYVSMQVAQATKDIRFIVQDRPEKVRLGEDCLPAEYKDRISFQPHDLFMEQPLKGADVYFLRKVLHEWADPICVQILRNLVPALKYGARIVVYERILSDRPESTCDERDSRCLDLVMLMSLNGRERSQSDWRETMRGDSSAGLEEVLLDLYEYRISNLEKQ